MRLRLLYSILLCCLVLVLPGVPSTSYSQTEEAITESKVLAIINSVDRATRKRNVAGMVAPLASDAKIKMTVSMPRNPNEQVFDLNKEQYAYLTRRALRSRFSYQFERKNTRVKIYDDQTAMVTSDLYESFTVQRTTLRAVSSEVAFLSLRAGKIVITAVESRTRFY